MRTTDRQLALLRRLPRLLASGLIRAYQLAVSPLFGPSCRFFPTCSEYVREAIAAYGLVRGVRLGIQRIARCHPWNPGGYDPVPPRAGATTGGAASAGGREAT
jgi:putative membrane protein insertion efficiency factor